MQPATACLVCGYEFDSPALDHAGPACPRCGELIGPPGTGSSNGVIDVFLGAALGGSLLVLLVAALLFTRN